MPYQMSVRIESAAAIKYSRYLFLTLGTTTYLPTYLPTYYLLFESRIKFVR